MSRRPRAAIPASEKGVRKTVNAPLLEDGGKKNPAKLPGSGINPDEKDKKKLTTVPPMESVEKRLFIPITKADSEEQTITGVVLRPEVVDAQGDIISKDVIRKAAHKFLSGFNLGTKLGLMHKDFKKRFELYESFIVPMDMVIADKIVPEGSWVIVVHVLDKTIWEQVKTGKLTGFSIGGKAKVNKVQDN